MAKKKVTKKNRTIVNSIEWKSLGKLGIAIAIILTLIALIFFETNDEKEFLLSERDAYYFEKASKEVNEVDSIWCSISSNPTPRQMQQLISKIKKLKYDYNAELLNVTTLKVCDSLKQRIEELQSSFVETIESKYLSTEKLNIVQKTNTLMEDKNVYPFFMRKGETLFLNICTSENSTITFKNSDLEKVIKQYKQQAIDTICIEFEGIYSLEINPQNKQYVDVNIEYKPISDKDLYDRPNIVSQRVECKKGESGASATKGVKMKNIFDETRKFTLRGQLKAALSGSHKAVVAINVPAGATDILYKMRIDTSESGKTDDGKFHENLDYSYRKINVLGLPIYESSKSSGILSMLLDDNRPIRNEDAYCNMYVFRNPSDARKFQDDTTPISQLKYDVDYSTLGTQSCNGRIPVNGSKTIYLGFENERLRYTNYLWVEAVAVIPNTLYFKEKFTIK